MNRNSKTKAAHTRDHDELDIPLSRWPSRTPVNNTRTSVPPARDSNDSNALDSKWYITESVKIQKLYINVPFYAGECRSFW